MTRLVGVEYPITGLVRGEDAGRRALSVTRRLVRLVSEFESDSYAVIELHCGERPGRVEGVIALYGNAADDLTPEDLLAAVGAAVALGGPTPAAAPSVPRLSACYELVRSAVSPLFPRPGSDDASQPEWVAQAASIADGAGFATPLPDDADSAEALIAAMARTDRRIVVRTVLGPADDLDAAMVVDDLNAALPRHAVADYARVPIVARTVVASPTGVPVAVRAALRQRGTGLRLVRIPATHATDLWSDPLSALRSAAVGEVHALALARVPAASGIEPLGMATVRPAAPERALDPVPLAPRAPIRLGSAVDAFGQTVSAELDVTDLLRHCYIEGGSGSGKTTLIVQLFRALSQGGHQVIYLDPHGDGAARAAAYASESGTSAFYVRHGDRSRPIRMNPLAEADPESRERVMADLLELVQNMLDPHREGMVGERFKRTFALVAQAASALFGPHASVTDVLALILTKDALNTLVRTIRGVDADAAARLDAELLSLGDKEYADLISWFVSRLQPFLRTPALREILGTGADSVDMVQVLETGTSLVVDLASFELGEDIARVLGALWLLKLRASLGRRSDRRRPVVLLVDEAHLYTFGALPGLLAEARKFGLGVVVATQSSDNLTPRLARAVDANCASAITLRTGISSAAAASERLGGWNPRDLVRLPDFVAAASLSRSGSSTVPFTLHVDHFDVVRRAGWHDERIAAAADDLAALTSEELWRPYASHRVLGDADVVRAVASAGRRRTNRESDTEVAPRPRTGTDEPQRTDVLLDDWMTGLGEPPDLQALGGQLPPR